MATQVSINFRGICTQLTRTDKVKGMLPIEILSGDAFAQHRVFLANSALIGEIDPDRNVVPHVPKLRIAAKDVTDDLKDILKYDCKTDQYERVLSNDAIVFEGLDPTKGKRSHYDSLNPALPSLREKSLEKGFLPVLRPSALRGWTPYASAYIDFIGASGALSFSVDANSDVLAMLYFSEAPKLILRHRNEGKGVAYSLRDNCHLEISNLPDGEDCGDSDYLLHYFATTLDMRYKAPEWDPRVKQEQKISQSRSGGPMSEVYCSSSTYP